MYITSLIEKRKFNNSFYFILSRIIYEIRLIRRCRIPNREYLIKQKFKGIFGYEPNLIEPKTLNEKIQWLKLNDHQDFHTICADKYAVREYIANRFGDASLIPLYFHTDDWRNINEENINLFPCIVKANHSSKDFVILRDGNNINWKELQYKCRWWLHRDYYAESGEWQYKNIKRRIIVEKLLTTNDGKIPNDYKLHYINGQLKFVYVSVDREGCNARNIYDENWEPLYFQWDGTDKNAKGRRGLEISAPKSFDLMKDYGKVLAKDFKYVRIDFYDVDGKLYFGEITLHHGGGFDVFVPELYDTYWGKMLKLD